MMNVKLIVVGNLKEGYLRDAAAEYSKRLGGFCKFETVQLKEEKISESPSDAEIKNALEREAVKIIDELPPRSMKIAMCVEGKQFSSEELSALMDSAAEEAGSVCFVIGSSYGLSDRVKSSCDIRMSVSKLTFPHQLMRVLLLEAVYRAFNISRGTRYHK